MTTLNYKTIDEGIIGRVLFLDLDDTIRHSKRNTFIKDVHDIEVFPDVIPVLSQYKDNGYFIYGISNQGGIAYNYKTLEQNMEEMGKTFDLVKTNGRTLLDGIRFCPYHPNAKSFPFGNKSLNRKPYYGMLVSIEEELRQKGVYIDYDRSILVGDLPEDFECAMSAGIKFQWAWDFFPNRIKPENIKEEYYEELIPIFEALRHKLEEGYSLPEIVNYIQKMGSTDEKA